MNNTINACPLCRNEVPATDWDDNRVFHFECKVCGTFRISDGALDALSGSSPHPDLSGMVRLRSETGQPQLVTRDNYRDLQSGAPAANEVSTKLRYLLRYVARKSQHPGVGVELDRDTDYPVCFGANADELLYFATCATELQYVSDEGTTRGSFCLTLTPTGWEEVQRIPTLESSVAFVAMSFAKDFPLLAEAWEHAIRPALEEDAGYKPVRIDQEHYLGDIVFEIIARIKDSRFVVADVTQHRNGVYFEGGYAMGMGLPVIWMCHKDDMDDTHFDTSHLNHIVWTDPADLRKNLANRILATIGRGPLKKP